MKQVKSDIESFARIRVIGAGGSGGNAINHMISSKVKGVDFIAINTDAQDLHNSLAKTKIHIGKSLTRGLGTGMNPELGAQSAEETRDEIETSLSGSDMVFITCGLGGGTGTGAAPIAAKIAREQGALTIAVVTKPFTFEGRKRMDIAEEGLKNLREEVDAIVVVPNDKILEVVQKDTGIKNAFAMCDDILKQAVEGISDLITTPGIVNVDFADIKVIMENSGSALMGIGTATGEGRATEAAKAAINSPLLDVSVEGATGVLFAVAGGDDLTLFEVNEAASVITESVDKDARVIFGAIKDDSLKKNEIKITVIATGFDGPSPAKQSIFGGTVKKELGQPKEEQGKIYNTGMHEGLPKKKELHKKDTPTSQKTKNVAKTQEAPKKKQEVQDDDWTANIPGFLRRSKLK